MSTVTILGQTFDIGSLGQWVAAAITFFAVLVALFKDELLKSWRKPILNLSMHAGPPDCHRTKVFTTLFQPALTNVGANCHYLRLWVTNTGKTRAESVQVFVAKLLRRGADGSYAEVRGFLPMNLRWSHSEGERIEIFASGISPKMGKHCDFGHVVDPSYRVSFGHQLKSVPAEQTILAFDVEFLSASLGYLVPPGTYRAKLLVAAANCAPRAYTLEVTLTGKWFKDETEMYTQGLGVSLTAD